MNTNAKRLASGAVSVGLVAGIVAAALLFGAQSAATGEEAPRLVPASRVAEPFTAPITVEDEAIAEAAREAARIEAERVAAEAAAAEAARVEAERVAAEQAAAQAAAEQAARDAAARNSGGSNGGGSQPQAPAPQAPPANPGGGDQQAGECREYNANNECTGWYVP